MDCIKSFINVNPGFDAEIDVVYRSIEEEFVLGIIAPIGDEGLKSERGPITVEDGDVPSLSDSVSLGLGNADEVREKGHEVEEGTAEEREKQEVDAELQADAVATLANRPLLVNAVSPKSPDYPAKLHECVAIFEKYFLVGFSLFLNERRRLTQS